MSSRHGSHGAAATGKAGPGGRAGSRPKPTAEHAKASSARADVMLERVRASGLKLTPQRMAIVRELAADPTHPTAQELFERLRPALPTMSFATVYNTLDALASAGLCAALALSPGASRFDPNMRAHHHAVCDGCGLVRDVALPVSPNSLDALDATEVAALGETEEREEAAVALANPDDREPAVLAAAPGFEIRSVERIYRGLCADCAAHARTPRARAGSTSRDVPVSSPKRRGPERSRSA